MFGHMIGTRPMLCHTTSITMILIGLGRCILYILPNFLVLPQYYSTSSGSIRFSIFENYYYHGYHGIRNSFHDRDHVHEFGTILHSLQGMVYIQLDVTGDFTSKTECFAQQQEGMISIQSIFQIYALDSTALRAHSRHEM